MAVLPQIDNSITNDIQSIERQLPSKTYKINKDVTILDTTSLNRFNVDRIEGFIDNLEAIKQAIYHILSIERYAYLIYSDNYGVEFQQYIGKDFEFIRTTIEDTIKEALLQDLRIKDVQITSINQVSNDKVEVKFTAFTIYGNLVLEVNINV